MVRDRMLALHYRRWVGVAENNCHLTKGRALLRCQFALLAFILGSNKQKGVAMADRTIDQIPADVPAFEGILEAVLLQALDEAREKMEAGEEVVPFTALAVGDTLFIETHPGDDADECFAAAQHTVQHVRGAAAYAFCYDGYVETNDGELDALIAEGGVPGSPTGHAIGLLYTAQGEGEDFSVNIDDRPLYIGQAPNFMEFTLFVDEEGADEGAFEGDEGSFDEDGVRGADSDDERDADTDYDRDEHGADDEREGDTGADDESADD